MIRLAFCLLLCLTACSDSPPTEVIDSAAPADSSFYSLQTTTLEGDSLALADYEGKVSLVVNVASKCGYTPQYEGLQALQSEFGKRGFNVLGFPSNEFGGQEPGSPLEIREFCSSNFGVEFPMFSKLETQEGENQSPIYRFLGGATQELPNWNFCKYLVGRDGKVIGFYPSKVAPDSDDLRAAIEAAL